jgi:hypothetical protein
VPQWSATGGGAVSADYKAFVSFENGCEEDLFGERKVDTKCTAGVVKTSKLLEAFSLRSWLLSIQL